MDFCKIKKQDDENNLNKRWIENKYERMYTLDSSILDNLKKKWSVRKEEQTKWKWNIRGKRRKLRIIKAIYYLD